MQEMQKFTLGTAVLAGGKSSRMGQNKVLMEYQNRRFLDRICEELRGFPSLLKYSIAALVQRCLQPALVSAGLSM